MIANKQQVFTYFRIFANYQLLNILVKWGSEQMDRIRFESNRIVHTNIILTLFSFRILFEVLCDLSLGFHFASNYKLNNKSFASPTKSDGLVATATACAHIVKMVRCIRRIFAVCRVGTASWQSGYTWTISGISRFKYGVWKFAYLCYECLDCGVYWVCWLHSA